MRVATFDLGTNTFLMLVAEVQHGELQPLFQDAEIVRIGRGVDRNGRLSAEAIGRAVDCLRRFVKRAESLGAEKMAACGTSALRDAKNREDFLRRVRAEVGIAVEIISGEREAELSFRGAQSNKAHLPGPAAMVDIGGGSTELCWGSARGLEGRLSLQIGSVRLTERYFQHDPVLLEEVQSVQGEIRAALQSQKVAQRIGGPATLLGVAGTVTTLAAMEMQMEPYDADRIDGSRLSLTAVKRQIERLAVLPVAERKKLRGLSPKRADVILAGAMILAAVMEALGAAEIVVSDRGLRHGLALEVAEREGG